MVNINILDGTVRIFAGSIIGAVFGAMGGYVALLGLIAPYFIVTGLGGYCPLYAALGWSTVEDPETNGHSNMPAPAENPAVAQAETRKAA